MRFQNVVILTKKLVGHYVKIPLLLLHYCTSVTVSPIVIVDKATLKIFILLP